MTKSRNPLISIIIPVFNIEKYLSEALESLISQTYPYWRGIIVDDGSSDKSSDIADYYAEKDERFTVIHQKNAGVSAARNKGLQNVSGDYVYFFDPDDILHPQTLQIAIKEITSRNYDLVTFGAMKFYEDTTLPLAEKTNLKIVDQLSKTELFRLFFEEKYHCQCCKGGYVYTRLYKKEILKNIWFDVTKKVYEDEDFCCKLYRSLDPNFKTLYIDTPLYFYRQRRSGAIRSARIKRLFALYSCRRNMLQYFDKNSEEYKILDKARLTTLIKLMQISLTQGYNGAFSLFRKILLSREDISLKTFLPYLFGPKYARTYSENRLKKSEIKNNRLKYWE